MRSKGPHTRAETTLGELVTTLDSRRVPLNREQRAKRPGTVPYYGATGRVGWIDEPLFDEELLLLGEDGAPFLNPNKSKAYIIDGPSWVNNHAHVLRAIDSLTTNSFLKHYLDHVDYRPYVTGTTRLKLTQRAMKSISVPLPSLREQARIVDAIEEHFSRLDAAEALVDASLRRLSRLLETAIRIELQKCPETSVPLHRVLSEGLSNGKSVRTAESGGFPVLRLTCLRNGSVDANETKQGDFGDVDPARYKVKPDDFLISRGNGSLHLVGLGGLVPADVPAVAYPDTLIRARVDRSRLRPKFLSLVWNSQVVRRQLESQARTTAGIYKVNQQMIERVALPIPSPDAQDEIVRNVDALQPSVEALQYAVTSTQRRIAELRKSVLTAAFSGRLVPQDPDDEPASVLLERIAACRPAAPWMTSKEPHRDRT